MWSQVNALHHTSSDATSLILLMSHKSVWRVCVTEGFPFCQVLEQKFHAGFPLLLYRVTEALFLLVQRGTNTAVVAMSTINNLALEQGY